MNEVAALFEQSAIPAHHPAAHVPIPPGGAVATAEVAASLPSPTRAVRKVFKTAFHQGTKYRDFVRGLAPTTAAGEGEGTFRVTDGTLYEAAEFAAAPNQAALVAIDEINRGPAVQVFGDTIVLIEADKRLADDGSIPDTAQSIRIIDNNGDLMDWHMPLPVYLIAAMNQADTSVEPLDVAFQRRWQPYKLQPDPATLGEFLGVDPAGNPPDTPTDPSDVFLVAVRAWAAVNDRIKLGRGPEYQLGHGVLMEARPTAATVAEAIEQVRNPWNRIRAHVDEVFFGHVRGIAAVLNVDADGHPFKIEDSFFAGDPIVNIVEPAGADLYKVLFSVGLPTVG